MTEVVVLCDAGSHGKRVRAGRLQLDESGPSPLARSMFKQMLGPDAEPDPGGHRERHQFECTRCGDRVTLGRPDTLERVRSTLLERGVSAVTLKELRAMLVPR